MKIYYDREEIDLTEHSQDLGDYIFTVESYDEESRVSLIFRKKGESAVALSFLGVPFNVDVGHEDRFLAADLGYHYTKDSGHTDGEYLFHNEECYLLDGQECWYEGSGLQAMHMAKAWSEYGPQREYALWMLMDLYHQRFGLTVEGIAALHFLNQRFAKEKAV